MPPILRMPYQQPAVVNQCNRLNKCSKRIDRGLNFLLQSWTLHVKIIFQSVLHYVCSTLMFVNTKSLTGWIAKQYNVIHFQPHLYLWSRFQILFFFPTASLISQLWSNCYIKWWIEKEWKKLHVHAWSWKLTWNFEFTSVILWCLTNSRVSAAAETSEFAHKQTRPQQTRQHRRWLAHMISK